MLISKNITCPKRNESNFLLNLHIDKDVKMEFVTKAST